MFIEQLLTQLTGGQITLNWANDPLTSDLRTWRAFRESDKVTLQSIAGWTYPNRPYKIDPLGERMAVAFSDFLFGDDPLVTSADENDSENLSVLLKENHFGTGLREAADICVSEREVWYRIYIDPIQLMWPILAWHSRTQVLPLMAGDRVLAVAFINDLGKYPDKDSPFYRHLEIHEDGIVQNILFRAEGSTDVGTQVPLTEHPGVETLTPLWQHGLEILAGVYDNKRSIYAGVQDLLLDLNEAHTIDSENFRLAGKKRAVMPRKYQDQAGNAGAGEEIYWVEDDLNEMEGDQGPFKILEYRYEGDQSIKRKEDLTNTILTRVGLARQLVDAGANEGLAQTGTALRTRLLPTLAAIKGLSKQFQDKLPHTVRKLQMVDELAEGSLGFGRPWAEAGGAPAVTLSSPIPQDQVEEANKHQTLINAELESIETAIEELRPGWTSQRRMLEVRRILANRNGYALDDQGNPVTAETATPGGISNEDADAGLVTEDVIGPGGQPVKANQAPGQNPGAPVAPGTPNA